jgi:hypothetical protein
MAINRLLTDYNNHLRLLLNAIYQELRKATDVSGRPKTLGGGPASEFVGTMNRDYDEF